MKYFRAYAQFETTRPELWARGRITDTLTSMPYVPDERAAAKNSPTDDMFFRPKTGFRIYTNSFEPLMRISTEETPIGCRVKIGFEMHRSVGVFIVIAAVFCTVFSSAMLINGAVKGNAFPFVFSLTYAPLVYGGSILFFRLTCRHVLRRVSESLEIYDKVRLLSGGDTKSADIM